MPEPLTLKACARCAWSYPNDILNPVIGSTLVQGSVCGLCALDMINAVHGMRRARFYSEIAEEFRVRAARWRQKHPEHKPTGAVEMSNFAG